MKHLLKNKKVVVALALALVIALGGISYSWFTVNGVPSSANVQGGRLRMLTARYMEYENFDDGQIRRVYLDSNGLPLETLDPDIWWPTDSWVQAGRLYEPSSSGLIGIELKNPNPDGLGIDSVTRIDNAVSNIYIWSGIDENGNATVLDTPVAFKSMEEVAAAYADVNASDLTFALDPSVVRHKMFYLDGEYLGMLVWLYDQAQLKETGEYQYYVTMSALPAPNTCKVDLVSSIELAASAGNRFQGCQVEITAEYDSTQPIAEACMAIWGEQIDLQTVPGDPDEVHLDSVVSARGVNALQAFNGPRISIEDARGMSTEELARFFFPDLFN